MLPDPAPIDVHVATLEAQIATLDATITALEATIAVRGVLLEDLRALTARLNPEAPRDDAWAQGAPGER